MLLADIPVKFLNGASKALTKELERVIPIKTEKVQPEIIKISNEYRPEFFKKRDTLLREAKIKIQEREDEHLMMFVRLVQKKNRERI